MNKPHFTFAGYSGSGKTTLAIKVIEKLTQKGVKIATLKHDGHKFEMDKEGKDTHRLKTAGSIAIGITSENKYAIIADTEKRKTFYELAELMPNEADIIIGEGFKDENIPKIIVYRKCAAKDRPKLIDNNIIAIATDNPIEFKEFEYVFDINDINKIALFIEHNVINKAL